MRRPLLLYADPRRVGPTWGMMMRVAIGAVTLAVGLALAGCGKSGASGNAMVDTSAAATAKPVAVAKLDVCTLLSAAEVEAITGDKLRKTQGSDVDGCNYKTSDDSDLQIQVDRAGGAHQMDSFRKAQQLLGGIGSAVATTGGAGADLNNALKKDGGKTPAIGDEVVWGAGDMLAVRKGDAYVQVTPPVAHDPATHTGFPLIPDAERRTMAQSTAEKLLAKL